MRQVVIWGASGHAKVVTEIIRLSGGVEIIGYIDSLNPQRRGERFLGSPILGGDECLPALMQRGVKTVVLGFGSNEGRKAAADRIREFGGEFLTLIHPAAIVSPSAIIQPGTMIAAGAVVGPGVSIGEHVIVNTGTVVDHDCQISDYVHLSPRSVLGGTVTVGEGSWVGIGATIIDHINIGAWSIIGAGSVVVRHMPDNIVAYGVPARVMKGR